MKTRPKLNQKILAFCICLLPALMFACSGGGGGGDGGGGVTGLENQAGISYSGATTQATVTDANAQALSGQSYEGGSTGATLSTVGVAAAGSGWNMDRPFTLDVSQTLKDSLQQLDLMSRAGGIFTAGVYSDSDTIDGGCGGSASYDISVDDQTGDFWGSFTYNSYCNDGIVISGGADFSGLADINTGDLLTFTFSFNNLTGTVGAQSCTMDGEISCDVTGSPLKVTMTMLLQDNVAAKVYWVKDFQILATDGGNNIQIEISGTFYHPDYGYVVITTPNPFVIYDIFDNPSDGVMIIEGNTGIAGGSTKAKLEAVNANLCQISADTNGDGNYDWNSGVINWSDL